MSKKLIIFTLIFFLSIVFWVSVKVWVEGTVKFADWQVWWWPLTGLIILSAATVMAFLLIREILWRVVISVLIGLAFLLVFDFNVLYPGTFSVLILLHLLAARSVHRESDQWTVINMGRILRHGLPWVITPLLIMTSFAYYLDPAVQASARAGQLPLTVRQTIAKTVDAFLGGELSQLPPAERQQTKNQIMAETERQLTNLAKPYFQYLPPALAFGLFLILQGLSFIFVWPAVWLGQGLFAIIRRAGFVKIVEKEVKAQTFEF